MGDDRPLVTPSPKSLSHNTAIEKLTPPLFLESLKDYFSTFGEVSECTVMRDGATGRSRGFGFLTFRDPRTVNIVMVKEHYLDGKIVRLEFSTSKKTPFRLCSPRTQAEKKRQLLTSFGEMKIDPKRAIPRDEQERTSKIFVGGVSQEANEQIFKEYFAQYGRVVDATLMMDKDTGRPRGFGFVTFDSEAAVENTLNGDLTILGKPIEVKKAQPRGDMQDGGESLGRGGRDRRGGRKGGYDDRYDNNNNGMNGNQGGNNNQQGNMNGTSGMTPQMMAQYWQKMQQYFATMQQQMAMAQGGMGGMGGMNPQMMQQMQAMQQMQQMKAMQMAQQQQQQGQGSGSASPMPPRSPSANAQMPAANMQGMNPQQMMQQMQQMQQMQAMQQAQMAGSGTPGGGGGGGRGTPGFNAQEQMAFEQRKYEEQQARRAMQEQGGYHAGGPTSWEGMYDDVPAPEHHGGGGRGRGRGRGGGGPGPERVLTPQSAPPANAPTGPKNAGKPGANYRGGGSRGGPRGFHPYAR